jgi:SAM-dependent methyltransferase
MMPRCLICSSSDVSVYLDETEDALDSSGVGSSRTILSPGRILRCRNCTFGFRQKRFNEEQLANLYRNMDPKVYQAELRGRSRTAERHLRIVEGNSRGGHILDVGCASGLFLSKAADAGWVVTGLEPSEVLYREAVERLGDRGTVLPLTLEEAHLGDQKFDAITLFDVLEHVVDPMETMKRCRDLLKPGGCLFLNVPDLDSLEARLLGRRWPLLLPEHMNYFNRPSLKLCGATSGLELVRFGRRRSFFSVQYVLFRLSQHRIPAAKLLSRIAQAGIGRVLIPVSLGETFAMFRRSRRFIFVNSNQRPTH